MPNRLRPSPAAFAFEPSAINEKDRQAVVLLGKLHPKNLPFSVLGILRKWPRTNCRECGQPTGMVRAVRLAEGVSSAADCPAPAPGTARERDACLNRIDLTPSPQAGPMRPQAQSHAGRCPLDNRTGFP